MLLETIAGIALAVFTGLGLLIALRQYKLGHSDQLNVALRATILSVVNEALDPHKTLLASHTVQLTQLADRDARTEDGLKENTIAVRDLSDKMTQMSVKVDMYWNSLEQLAMNAAKGLHQPHPGRERLDHLLEQFIEGTLTDTERTELKKILVQVRNYEPDAPPLDFPVFQGEQTFAAILLSTMDLVNVQHLAAMGHNLHRSARHKGK